MSTVLVIAPHADDETLGCAGTLLRHIADGDEVHWVIVTSMNSDSGYSDEVMERRSLEIKLVGEAYGFTSVTQLGFPVSMLDHIPLNHIISSMSEVFQTLRPSIVYIPFRSDAHSDHRVSADAAVACSKQFRCPSLRAIYAYETPSETDANIHPDNSSFRPQLFTDISEFLERKIEIVQIYESELKPHPFPRSLKYLRSLAAIRGAQAGFEAAESFAILRMYR